MPQELGVGLIGVNATRGWARDSHVPAVQALEGLHLVAVATRSQQSADAAASEFGADRAYGDALGLIADPGVDIVGVASSVPSHRELILAAVRHGKHVLTEWPLGIGSAENAAIVSAAAESRRGSRSASRRG
jgi:predicted dehydrogenase